MRKDGKDNLKSRFSEYLQQKWKDPKSLDSTVERFSSTIFDIFFEWQEYLEVYWEDAKNHYDRIFNKYVLPKMKNIISNKNKQNRDRPIYFKPITYNKYKWLFISFVEFIKENGGYTNGINLTERKEHLENSLQWLYWNFNKKELIRAWHDYIQKDTWKNGDKLRGCLADIYQSSDDKWLEKLYEIFFSSYEICSKITSENKWKQNFEKKDAFKEAFSKLEEEIPKYYLGKLGEIRSLFWKYLNFIPRYREKLITTIEWKPEQWEEIQRNTESELSDNFNITRNWAIDWNPYYEWDWFWPVEIVSSDEYSNITWRWDVLPPDKGIFPDDDTTLD